MPLKLGELLLRHQVITKHELDKAFDLQKRNNSSVGYNLVKMGFVTDEEIAACLRKQFGIAAINLSQTKIDQNTLDLVPVEVCVKHSLIPVDRTGAVLTVAMSDPTNIRAMDEVHFISGYQVEPVVTSEYAIEESIDRYYGSTRVLELRKTMQAAIAEHERDTDEDLRSLNIGLSNFKIEKAVLDLVPAEVCREYHLFPLKRTGAVLNVAMANPTDLRAMDAICHICGYQAVPVLATESAINEAIDKYYGPIEGIQKIQQKQEPFTQSSSESKSNASTRPAEEDSVRRSEKAQILRSAQQLISAGRVQEAIDDYLKILKGSPEDWNLMVQISDLYLKIKKTNEALIWIEKVANHYFEEGFYLKAIAVYKKYPGGRGSLEACPEYHVKLADLYIRSGLNIDARTELKSAARLCILQNKCNESIQILKKLVELEPETPSVEIDIEAISAAEKTGEVVDSEDESNVNHPNKEYFQIKNALISKNVPTQVFDVLDKLYQSDPAGMAILNNIFEMYTSPSSAIRNKLDSESVSIQTSGTRSSAQIKVSGSSCPYCKSEIKPSAGIVACAECRTFYHPDCWSTSSGCSVFGCSGKRVLTLRGDTELSSNFESPREPEREVFGIRNIEARKPSSLWGRSILLTFLAAVALHIFVLLFGGMSLESNRFLPSSFAWVWAIGFLVLISLLASRIGVTIGNFWAAMIFGGLLSMIFWMFLPENIRFFSARYVGLNSRISFDTHTDRFNQEEYDYPLEAGYLYDVNDPQLRLDAKQKSIYSEQVGTRGFLFWQTGYAMGYDPILLKQRPRMKGFLSRVEFFFTVGPLAIVESILIASVRDFPLFMVCLLVWFAWKREHIWFS